MYKFLMGFLLGLFVGLCVYFFWIYPKLEYNNAEIILLKDGAHYDQMLLEVYNEHFFKHASQLDSLKVSNSLNRK